MLDSLQNKQKLFIIKIVHTFIYLLMVAAIFYVVYAGLTKTYGLLLWISLGLVSIEGVVFLGSGMRCPLTALAKQYGDPKGYVGDIFLPEKIAKSTFRIFGTIFMFGLLMLLLDLLKIR